MWLLLFFFASCGQQEDVGSEGNLSWEFKGLGAKVVSFELDDGGPAPDTLDWGQKVFLKVSETSGFTFAENGANAGASMKVVNATGSTVYERKDFYAQTTEGLPIEEVLNFPFFLEMKSPIEKGQAYTWSIRVWDKTSGASLEADANFFVKSTSKSQDFPEWFTLKTKGTKTVDAYLSIGDKVVTNNKIPLSTEVNFNLIQVSGFPSNDGIVELQYSSIMEDLLGNQIQKYTDTLNLQKDFGFLNGFLKLGSPLRSENLYVWKVSLADLKGDASIGFEAELYIEP